MRRGRERATVVRVDNDRCELYGICVAAAPEVFWLSDNRLRHGRRIDTADEAAVAAAARNCPMQAIRLRESAR